MSDSRYGGVFYGFAIPHTTALPFGTIPEACACFADPCECPRFKNHESWYQATTDESWPKGIEASWTGKLNGQPGCKVYAVIISSRWAEPLKPTPTIHPAVTITLERIRAAPKLDPDTHPIGWYVFVAVD